MTEEDRFLAYQQRILDTIAKHGVMLQGVFPHPDEEEPSPEFVYTIGLTIYKEHPEIITFGLPFEVASVVLNDMARQVREGRVYHAGEVLDDVFVDLDAMLIQVADPTTPHLTQAYNLWEDDLTALQLVSPDSQGRYPWEEGYDIDPRVQPLLGQAPT